MADSESTPSKRRAGRYVVAKASDVPPGTRLLVNIEGREVGIFNVDGTLHAILNRCPHRGGDLCKGNIVTPLTSTGPGELRFEGDRKFIMCPWHRWEFDLETGQSWCDAANPAPMPKRRYAVRPFGVEVTQGATIRDGDFVDQTGAGVDVAVVDSQLHRIKGPYTADIFPVELEDEYVVISFERATGKLA